MRHHLRRFAIIASVVAVGSLAGRAQMRVVPLDDDHGHVALGLALRHLTNTGILLHTTAHPDDENNGLLVMLNRGQGYKTALATATRGNGGQNEIGPEIFEALGVLRTEELAALHRFDGANQYFTRAVDFGYSFSIEETFEKWGKNEITADYVRLIRMIRPDVVISLMPDGPGGGQHHQASALITHDAVKLAGDSTKYPEQIKEGLRPWQPRKFYYSTGFGPAAQKQGRETRINLAVYDPLLGRTYAEIGTEARSMHKCQGMAQLLALPGPASTAYRLTETTIAGQMDRDEKSLFDGVDTTVQSLARFAGQKPPKDLTEGLTVIATSAQNAMKAFDTQSDEATLQPLLAGLFATRVLRRELRGMNIDENGKYEIDFRLRQKEQEFQQAILQADAVRVDVLADDGVLVPGQKVNVSVTVANRGGADVAVKAVNFEGFDASSPCELKAVGPESFFPGARRQRQPPTGPTLSVIKKDVAARCETTMTVPANARISEPYWHRKGEEGRYTFDADAPFGLPFRPSPFYAQVTMMFPNGEEVIDGLPVQYRYEGNIFSGEKRIEPLVVPAYSVRVEPETAIVPADSLRRAPQTTSARPATAKGKAAERPAATGGRQSAERPAATAGRRAAAAKTAPVQEPAATATASEREIRVTVTNDTTGAADSVVRLQAPEGWTLTPPEQAVKFTRADESQTVRFQVTPAAGTAPGEYHVKAIVSAGDQAFDRGFQVIEYPHIRRRHIYHDADVTLKVVDVKTTPNLTVGYVMGVGDQVPPAIEQLGAKVEMLGSDDLAWGNLSRFDAIVTGVRAYERRDDLRANNSRLLDYVMGGGTLIVQYNKFEFNDAQYGPYPAKVSSSRVTDEHAPVRVLDPDNPVFNTPNRITDRTWEGWVQERGLYFLGEHDSRYHELLQMEDPFPLNQGVKTGALVEAQYGKGRWVYVGLNLWRQLPAGTDGAYQILANLLAIGKTSNTRTTAQKGH